MCVCSVCDLQTFNVTNPSCSGKYFSMNGMPVPAMTWCGHQSVGRVSKLEERKLDRGMEGVQEEQTKCKEGYFLSKEKKQKECATESCRG